MFLCKIKCEKTQKLCICVKNLNDKIVYFLENYASAFLLLAARLWMANIFFKSGLTKIANIDTATALFEYEYSLPFISAELATYLAIIFELGCSVLIAFGLLSRLAVIPMIAMTLVIQILVYQNIEHFYWLFLFSMILIYGSGRISIDYICKKLCKRISFSKALVL